MLLLIPLLIAGLYGGSYLLLRSKGKIVRRGRNGSVVWFSNRIYRKVYRPLWVVERKSRSLLWRVKRAQRQRDKSDATVKESHIVSGEWTYHFNECTGFNQKIVIDGKRYFITFDPRRSNQEAYELMICLDWTVLYANVSDIRIIGSIDTSRAVKVDTVGYDIEKCYHFVLEHWYLTAPFKKHLTEASSVYEWRKDTLETQLYPEDFKHNRDYKTIDEIDFIDLTRYVQ